MKRWLTWPLAGSLVKSPQYSSGMRPSSSERDRPLRLAGAALGRRDYLFASAPDAVVECLDAVLGRGGRVRRGEVHRDDPGGGAGWDRGRRPAVELVGADVADPEVRAVRPALVAALAGGPVGVVRVAALDRGAAGEKLAGEGGAAVVAQRAQVRVGVGPVAGPVEAARVGALEVVARGRGQRAGAVRRAVAGQDGVGHREGARAGAADAASCQAYAHGVVADRQIVERRAGGLDAEDRPSAAAEISDAILDAFIENDVKLGIADESKVNTRLGCETLCTTNKIVIAGEGRGQAPFFHKHGDSVVVNRELIAQIARDVVKDIGYDQDGFSYYGADVEVLLHGQSPDIAMGVDAKKKKGGEEEGAGDQGMMFGFACTESEVYEKGSFMPAPIYFAHKILKVLSEKRRSGQLFDLQPDAKSQVTVKYVDGKPVGCTKVVVSTQHNAESRNGKKYTPNMVKEMIADAVSSALPEGWMPAKGVGLPGQPDRQLRGRRSRRRLRSHRPQDHRRHLRRLRAAWRRCVLRQGPDQGRPFGRLRGALSRQERGRRRHCRALHHPDRLCDRCRRPDVAPGRHPRDRQGRGEEAGEDSPELFPLRPTNIRRTLKLTRPIYRRTAAYGHFGRAPEKDGGFAWERTDLASQIKSAVR